MINFDLFLQSRSDDMIVAIELGGSLCLFLQSCHAFGIF